VGRLQSIHSRRIGLSLSGGSVRGLAHIGVFKALTDAGIRPSIITGTSAGSIIGAGIAAGMDWQDLAAMARQVFWPRLLHGRSLEEFCRRHLPLTFADLELPFAAIATRLPDRQPITLASGVLASAINASCAMRVVRRPVKRDGHILKDGGLVCVLPSEACRTLGADFIIGSDVWELSSVLRGLGLHHTHPHGQRIYPGHYHAAVRDTDLLIHPEIPVAGYLPTAAAIDRMIAVGESAARRALSQFANATAA
jgi:NTE family protein